MLGSLEGRFCGWFALEQAPGRIGRGLKTAERRCKELTAARAEQAIAAIFREHLKCEVIYTSNGVYTPDGGIDFVLVNSERGLEYAFQVCCLSRACSGGFCLLV